MLVFPGCKINLGLQLTHRRPDGFHNLLSAFYPVVWSDMLEIIPAPAFGFTATGLPIPAPMAKPPGNVPEPVANNLCVRAYEALRADFALPPVQMHLHKLVPIGAGLGGGSADAAATINLLNTLFDLHLTTAQREAYARKLGSDCAFFIENKPRYCTEKGDVFEDIDLNLSGHHIRLVYPALAISTAEAYAGVVPCLPAVPLRTLLQAPIGTWREHVHNDFEDSLFPKYPALAHLKDFLYQQGAIYASLSGSGSTVYGIFSAPPEKIDLDSRYTVWDGKL